MQSHEVKKLAPGIIINHARLIYKDKILFDDLHIELSPGQFTCLLGPSGAGKTSLLRLIAGLDSGTQAAADIHVSDHSSLQQHIAYIAQKDALLPWLTVLENVYLGLRLRGKKITSKNRERAKELLNSVGLQDALQKKPAELSGGMRQRCALARTLFEDQPIVLMDEPFAALDAITKWRLQTLTANLLKDKTVLLITHDPLEALRLGHRIYVLSGSPATISEELLLTDAPPRDLHHSQLAQWQSQLIDQLTRAQQCEA